MLAPCCLLALALACTAAALAALPASASPGTGAPTVITLGDSYISGEAGRWEGNSISPLPGHDGTDRGRDAYRDGTDEGGCHRSDVAEARSASLPGAEGRNIACSGAKTEDVFRASSGGKVQHGEPPQADQLLPIAKERDIEMVVLSIGGNDLGFASIVQACFTGYVRRSGPCKPTQQARVDAALPRAAADVERAIDEIRAVMAQAGYRASDFRLVLQTYPSVMPRASEARYGEAGSERTTYGCPFYDVDLDWARDEVSKQIGAMVKRAAEGRGAEWMDVGDLFQGHEVCSRSARQSTATDRPTAAEAEWGRMLSGTAIAQGETQELFHPNAIGQRALGACLSQLYATGEPGRFACTGAAGIAPGAVALRREATLASAAPALRLRARRVDRGRRTCLRFTVTTGGRPVRGATVRFAGRRARTGRRGRTTICARTARPRGRATARKAGYRPARRSVRIARRG